MNDDDGALPSMLEMLWLLGNVDDSELLLSLLLVLLVPAKETKLPSSSSIVSGEIVESGNIISLG